MIVFLFWDVGAGFVGCCWLVTCLDWLGVVVWLLCVWFLGSLVLVCVGFWFCFVLIVVVCV